MLLEVGDVVYRYYGSKIDGKFVIDRVTQTKAIAGKTEFRREFASNGMVQPFNSERFSLSSYYKATPELDAKFHRDYLIYQLSKIDWNEIDTPKLEVIDKILRDIP